MATESNENETTSADTEDAPPPQNGPCFGQGCGCGKPAGNSKLKVAVCLLVIVAVCGILLFKTTSARQNAPDFGKSGFSSPLATTAPSTTANNTGQRKEVSESLPSVSALNTVAANLDVVFLVIPNQDNDPVTKETGAAVAAVERTLKSKGISTGVFTLQTGSPDYPDVAARVSAPGIVVMSKGSGMGTVSGRISETNLMQAYVASTRGGGCCSGSDKAPSKCN